MSLFVFLVRKNVPYGCQHNGECLEYFIKDLMLYERLLRFHYASDKYNVIV